MLYFYHNDKLFSKEQLIQDTVQDDNLKDKNACNSIFFLNMIDRMNVALLIYQVSDHVYVYRSIYIHVELFQI